MPSFDTFDNIFSGYSLSSQLLSFCETAHRLHAPSPKTCSRAHLPKFTVTKYNIYISTNSSSSDQLQLFNKKNCM